jgi:DNA-binding NarL/FixJ family response regulator
VQEERARQIKGVDDIDPFAGHRGTTEAGLLIVIERRDFIRGCLTSWLRDVCAEFAALPVADAETYLNAAALGRAAAVLVAMDAPERAEAWLMRQVGWLRSRSPNMPVIMIADDDEARAAEALARRSNVQGYIPTSSSVSVAAAALRLVVAGGRYFPALSDHNRQPVIRPTDPASLVTRHTSLAQLTAREAAVLGVLGSGAPNKIIAYRLGMSLSTVKAHVHSIIRKLKVRNRTEVVVAARNMQLLTQRSNGEAAFNIGPDVWGRRTELSGPAAE